MAQLTFEEIKAEYFDESVLKIPLEKFYRVGSDSKRLYYKFVDGKPKFYPSCTTLLGAVLQKSPFLIDWMIQHGKETAKTMLKNSCEYGTLMHNCNQKLLIDRIFDLTLLRETIKDVTSKHNLDVDRHQWYDDLSNDVLACKKWIQDHNVVPIMIEEIVGSDILRVAGAVDLLCYMDYEFKGFFGEIYKSGDKKGQPKETKQIRRIIALVDFKSGRKGFYLSHEVQLEIYKRATKETFPELQNEEIFIFNWSPKAWRNTPSYNFVNQTDKHSSREIEIYSELYHLTNSMDMKHTNYSGIINLDEDISNNHKTYDINKIVEKRHEDKG
jgi:hypothetical protein